MESREWTIYAWEYAGGPLDGLGSSGDFVPYEIAPNDYPNGSYIRAEGEVSENGLPLFVWHPTEGPHPAHHAATA